MSKSVDNTETFEQEIRPLLEAAAIIAQKNDMGIVAVTCTKENEEQEAYSTVYWAPMPDDVKDALRFLPVRLAYALATQPKTVEDRINIVQMTAVHLGVWDHIDTSIEYDDEYQRSH
jgi:hypothetical protein